MGSILPHAPGSPRGTFSRETPLDDGAPRASPSLPPTTARGSDPRELAAAHRGERVDLEDLVRGGVPREAFAPGHSLTREGVAVARVAQDAREEPGPGRGVVVGCKVPRHAVDDDRAQSPDRS